MKKNFASLGEAIAPPLPANDAPAGIAVSLADSDIGGPDAILSEIFIQIGYFFYRVMQESKSDCFFI